MFAILPPDGDAAGQNIASLNTCADYLYTV